MTQEKGKEERMGEEKKKRDFAIDGFAAAMQERLDEQAAKGYTGWDGDYSAVSLRQEILDDASKMEALDDDRKAVDIAARCMMLWYRRQPR